MCTSRPANLLPVSAGQDGNWLLNDLVQCGAMSVYLPQTLIGITTRMVDMVKTCSSNSIRRGLIIKHLLVHHVSLLPMLLLPQLLTMKPVLFEIPIEVWDR